MSSKTFPQECGNNSHLAKTYTHFFFCNQDGTCIPVTLFHHKDLKTDGRNPLLLHVYGMTELCSPPLVLKKL